MSTMLSYYFVINVDVASQKQYISAKVISHRKFKSIDKDHYLTDLWVSSPVIDTPDDVDHLENLNTSTLRDLIDEHKPLRTKEMTRPFLSWYIKDITTAKKNIKYCERLWVRTGLCTLLNVLGQ